MKIRVPFVGSSYQALSLNADAQRAVNCFLEMDNNSPRAPVALYGTEGTVLKAALPDSPVRGCISQDNYSYWVAGNGVYRVTSTYGATLLGSINTAAGEIGICSNGSQILIVDGVAGYIITISSGTLTQIADTEFPNGVTRCAYQDGYFLVSGKSGSPSFWINQTPYSGAAWDALDFASAEGAPDNTITLISDHRELWLFGVQSAEIWVNTGSTDFPFSRSGNAFIETGCAAAGTVVKADSSVFWLGKDDRGQGIVWRADGYTPMRISTHAVEKAISDYVINGAFAFSYQNVGHTYYVLTFPTSNATWVYDASTQQWHERAWRNPLTGALNRWRANCFCSFNGDLLVGDFENGNIYGLDLNTYTDNGDPILRLRAAQTMEQTQDRIFISSLQVDMETGVGIISGQGSNPQLMMRFSNDGGHTWSNYSYTSIGAIGDYGARAMYWQLGQGRNRVFEITMTDPVKFAVFGAVIET